MSRDALKLLRRLVEPRGFDLVNSKELAKLQAKKESLSDQLRASLIYLSFLGVPPDEANELLKGSCSQLGQDVFAFLASGKKTEGYFVEFGAGDGVHLSNTLMLERLHGWKGILAEPLVEYHESILAERAAILDGDCVWRTTGESLKFVKAGYLSTIESFVFSDRHGETRASGASSSVTTVSLWDLLKRHKAPSIIDFLSIDTEGSEFDILKAFPFDSKYEIRAIACEHNYSPSRDSIRELLVSRGYRQIDPSLSHHDDWFVLDSA